MAITNWKLPGLIESSGGNIVGEEMCTGERGTRNMTSTEGETVDALIDNIVNRYFKIDCAIFTPNQSRIEHVNEMAGNYNADGVLNYSLQFCHPYQHESIAHTKQLESKGVPVLNLTTDYSQEDIGQLKTRIEAFIERIKS